MKRYPLMLFAIGLHPADLGQDIAFSEKQLKIGQRLVTKIWNAFRFIHEHIAQVDPDAATNALGAANEWLLHHSNT